MTLKTREPSPSKHAVNKTPLQPVMLVRFICVCQACLTQLDEEFFFNPLSLGSNLYHHLRTPGLLSQPWYPYRSAPWGDMLMDENMM